MINIIGFLLASVTSQHRALWIIAPLLFVFIFTGLYFLPFPGFSTSTDDIPEGITRMSNEEMRDISGRSLLNFVVEDGTHSGIVDNTNRTFVRAEIDGQVDLIAGVEEAVVGDYYRSCCSQDSDMAINSLVIEGNSSDAATLQDPYVEIAYSNFDDDSNRRLDGIRVGAESITGQMYFDLHIVSGGLKVDTIGGMATVEEPRATCMNTWLGCFDLGLGAGIEYSGSEDLWLSINNRNIGSADNAILWEHQNPYLGNANGRATSNESLHTDGQGFWLHSTDGGYASVF